jgi:hypothetical protein
MSLDTVDEAVKQAARDNVSPHEVVDNYTALKAKWDALKVNLPEGSQERFEVHHIIPKYVLKRLGLADHANSVPCILLEKADHNKGRLTRPKSFHSILIDLIPENDGPFNRQFPDGLRASCTFKFRIHMI